MLRYLTTAAILLFAVASQAQPSGGPQPANPPSTGAPIDGGASLLLAGGVGYVIRKVRQRRAK